MFIDNNPYTRHAEELKYFEDQLSPCPFCGGKGIFVAQQEPSYYECDQSLFIMCTECECQSKKVPAKIEFERIQGLRYLSGVWPESEYNCVNDLMRAWNRRMHSEPKKPEPSESGCYYICPSCNKFILRREKSHGNIDIPHCKWCGQALDWG